MRFAQSVVIDHVRHQVVIDGIAFPWHIEPDPQVTSAGTGIPISVVTLGVFVDSTVEVRTSDRRTFYHEGTEVGKFARELVRQGFAEADNYPWALPPSIDEEN